MNVQTFKLVIFYVSTSLSENSISCRYLIKTLFFAIPNKWLISCNTDMINVK